MEQRFFTIKVAGGETREERMRRRRERAALRAAVALAFILLVILAIILISPGCTGDRFAGMEEAKEVEQAITVQMPEPVETRKREAEPSAQVSRYRPITESERELIARVVYLEARGEPAEGQQAVAEVILNRVAADNFPDSVEAVVYQEGQFSTAGNVGRAEPGDKQYAAVDAAMYGEAVLPLDVVYFSQEGENERVWGEIGGHVFCYQYIWE